MSNALLSLWPRCLVLSEIIICGSLNVYFVYLFCFERVVFKLIRFERAAFKLIRLSVALKKNANIFLGSVNNKQTNVIFKEFTLRFNCINLHINLTPW